MSDRVRLLENSISAVLLMVLLIGGIFLYRQQNRKPSIVISGTEQESSFPVSAPVGTQLLVDVAGAVNSPGVYLLSGGDRVEHALEAAGGLAEDADLDRFQLSRAAPLQDGQKIVIPRVNQQISQTQVSGGPSGCVDINLAQGAELDALPGIGAVRTGQIIENRPYLSLETLVSEKIIPASVYEDVKDQLCPL